MWKKKIYNKWNITPRLNSSHDTTFFESWNNSGAIYPGVPKISFFV